MLKRPAAIHVTAQNSSVSASCVINTQNAVPITFLDSAAIDS